MNLSGRFAGVARMTSESDNNVIFDFWSSNIVRYGVFSVEWLIVKDFPNKHLKAKNIMNLNGENVIFSRDCSEIDYSSGVKFIREYELFPYITSILQHFEYFDERENAYRQVKNKMCNNNHSINNFRQSKKTNDKVL